MQLIELTECGQAKVFRFLLLLALTVVRSSAWDYGANGADWNEGVCLNPELASKQSPIELPSSVTVDTSTFMYYTFPIVGEPVTLYNNRHSLAMTMPESFRGGISEAASAQLVFADSPVTYRLWQVNFHAPSEHTRDGKQLPLELQMVHKESNSDKLAVVSVLFSDGGSANSFLSTVSKWGLPKGDFEEVVVNRGATPPSSPGAEASPTDMVIDFKLLLKDKAFYKYEGSLTIPPCETEVQYYVAQHPIPAQADQLELFSEVLRNTNPPKGNFRNLTPLGNRELKLIAGKDINKEAFVPPKIVIPEGGAAGPSNACKEVSNDPQFDTLTVKDSEELRAVKEKYQNAKLNSEGARSGAVKAKNALMAAQALYDAAPGVVEKIDQKWVIIDKTNAFNGAAAGADSAEKEYEKACAEAMAVVNGLNAAKVTTTTATPTEAGSDAVATTRVPTEAPPVVEILPGKVLLYHPLVYLPRGEAGNPFFRNAPERTARIGGSESSKQVFDRLSANLRQPEGTLSDVAVPILIKATTTTTTETTTAAPVELKLTFGLEESAIPDKTKFTEDLTATMAKLTGVDAKQIKVTPALIQQRQRLRRTRKIVPFK